MPWKFLSGYFSFTKKERNGILLLITLILIFFALPFFYPLFIQHKKNDPTQFEKEIAALKIKTADSSHDFFYKDAEPGNRNYQPAYNRKEYSSSFKGILFDFDPNTIADADWKRLGLRDKTIATIRNYLNKGGKFYKPEDISRIWGLHPDEIQRLLPYVKIAAINHYVKIDKPAFEKTIYKKETKIIDINTADSIAFVDLPGIGAGFTKRILNFRNRLGGFVSVQQISETYGLPDSTFQKIKPRLSISNATVKQFNINIASIDEMKVHPYIRYAIANAIVQYRTQHGNFSSVNDIKKIMLVTDDVFGKITPYLNVGQ
ncbi:MAG: helix-hairpin-helix domain-containing protein [Ferruginibacter sp.]